jgi:lipopolysaccharide export system permease protein
MILPFLGGTFTVVFLFLMQLIMNKLDELLGKGIDPMVILEVIVLNMSWMLVLAVPMGVLFATLMAFGGMSATYETTVIKASGGSLLRMMAPVMVIGFLLFIGMYWYNDVVLPETNHRVNVLQRDIQRTKPTLLLEKGKFIQQLDGYTILSRELDSVSGQMYGVTIYDNRSSLEKNVVSADSGSIAFSSDYSKLILDLYDGEVHQSRLGDVDNYRIIDFDNYQVISRQSGFSFNKSDGELVSKGQREMSIAEMKEVVERSESRIVYTDSLIDSEIDRHLNNYLFKYRNRDSLTADTDTVDADIAGTDSGDLTDDEKAEPPAQPARSITYKERMEIEKSYTPKQKDAIGKYELEMKEIDSELSTLKSRIRSRLSQREDHEEDRRQYLVEIYKKYSIPFACFVFVMVGCPLGIKTKGGNFGTSAVISLGFYVLFWICLIGGEKLADSGFLEPWLAMWLCNIVVGLMGLFLMLKVNNENFTLFRRN